VKIGEFSKLSRVPEKTLRYYDEIGLLKPAQVDPFTGYRQYSVDQLVRLNTILALKDLGFSLEQVARMLEDSLTPEQLRGMLRLRQAEIEQRMQSEQARLARVEARLKQIEEDAMPEYEVVIKQTEPVRVAAVRGTVPNYGSVSLLFNELFGELGRQRVAPVGPPVAVYYDEDYRERDVDVEIIVPVGTARVQEGDRLKVRDIPALEVASLVRVGPYDNFTPAYQALMTWIQESGYCIAGPNREIYLRGPESGGKPEEYITEIQFPVARK
jgi:DNA-binding transcriptional MerR regulator